MQKFSWMLFMKKVSSQHIRSRRTSSVLIYQDMNGKILYEVERGLDVAYEYAPGRAIRLISKPIRLADLYHP